MNLLLAPQEQILSIKSWPSWEGRINRKWESCLTCRCRHVPLTHCILVNSFTVICWTSPFVILGVLGLFCCLDSYSFFDGKSCWQTVYTLIRCHIMWHLVWVCTVCLRTFYGFAGKKRLKTDISVFKFGEACYIEKGYALKNCFETNNNLAQTAVSVDSDEIALSLGISVYSQTSMAPTSFEPWKHVWDRDSWS